MLKQSSLSEYCITYLVSRISQHSVSKLFLFLMFGKNWSMGSSLCFRNCGKPHISALIAV